MAYNYKIGYYSHEESDYIEHEKKFSDNELTEIIAEFLFCLKTQAVSYLVGIK